MARPRYMLDTNVVSALVRRPDGDLARRVGALPSGSLAFQGWWSRGSFVTASNDADRSG